jgi:PAS domain S-box-containing protein
MEDGGGAGRPGAAGAASGGAAGAAGAASGGAADAGGAGAAGAAGAGAAGRFASRLDSTPPDLLAALVDSVADGLYLVDAVGRVRFVNPAGLALLGYAQEDDLLGKPSHATIHGVRPDGTPFPEDECPLLAPRRTGEVVHVEDDWFVRRDGSFVNVAYSSAPVASGDGGRGAVVVFRDVSGRREAERERARAAEAAAEAQSERAAAAQSAALAQRERAAAAQSAALAQRERVAAAQSAALAAELQASRARIVAAADAERVRLGRDLHDGAQQRLVHVALSAQLALGRVNADDPDGARELLGEALAEARTAIEELRDLAAGIHPSVLTNRGLRAAIEALTARAPVPTAFAVPEDRFAPPVEAAAYFVVSEALANVAKHARAATARVDVRVDGDELVVEVGDDGRGGAALGADAGTGSGLRGLEDRVGALGGTLTVTSAPGEGTQIRARLPL